MIDIKPALQHLNIDCVSVIKAMQDVRAYAELDTPNNRLTRVNDLLQKVFGFSLDGVQIGGHDVLHTYEHALTVAQAAFERAIKMNCTFDDADQLKVEAVNRASALIAKPSNSWMFAQPESTQKQTSEVHTIGGVDVAVVVKSDGKIKKGGKEVIALELYRKHVLDATEPLSNKALVELFMKEMNMSKAGATTYAYNVRKKLGENKAS